MLSPPAYLVQARVTLAVWVGPTEKQLDTLGWGKGLWYAYREVDDSVRFKNQLWFI